jgi:signal transduction histidine kinase
MVKAEMKKNILINAGLVLALLILATITSLSCWQMNQIVMHERAEDFTFSVIQNLDRLLGDLREARADLRDYSMSRDEQYVKSFREAFKNIEGDLESLVVLTGRQPRLQERLEAVVSLGRRRLATLENRINEISKETTTDRMGTKDHGKGEVAALRSQVAAAKEETVSLMREVSAKQESDFRRMERLTVVNGIAMCCLFIMVFLMLRQDIDWRIKREQELVWHGAEFAIQEKERLALSREVHDGIGQSLTVLKLDLTWIERKFHPDSDELTGRLKDMRANLDHLIKKAQQITADLRPPLLDNLGLAAAIEWQAREFERLSGIACHCTLDEDIEMSDEQIATTIVRIFQEALTNIIRHSGATEVSISLSELDGRVTLQISDNGRGITIQEIDSPTAYGIMGMRERAAICQAELTIRGTPGKGTTVRLSMPRATKAC